MCESSFPPQIAALYAELRQQSAVSGGVPIAVRHIESVMRMAEASARMHLREHVRDDDVDLAIKVVGYPSLVPLHHLLSNVTGDAGIVFASSEGVSSQSVATQFSQIYHVWGRNEPTYHAPVAWACFG